MLANQVDSEHFRTFATALEERIGRYGKIEDWDAHQKKQLEQLIGLETKFRKILAKHRFGKATYEGFVNFITKDEKNILAARPYFRERQETFARDISRALKNEDAVALQSFSINYQFVLFVMQFRKWAAGSKVAQIAGKIRVLRQAIVEMNMPLGISRARVFYSRTPHSHLSYMDEIQIAAEGMMSGVDKYTSGPGGVDPKVFRSTMIGRMVGNFIEDYSETLVHFYPVDKRKIYRANKAVGRFPQGVDFESLAHQVNVGDGKKRRGKKQQVTLALAHKTTASEIAELMAAASVVSADSCLPTDPDAPEPITRFAAPESTRPDVQVEKHDLMALAALAVVQLTVYERKLLRLKGVRLTD